MKFKMDGWMDGWMGLGCVYGWMDWGCVGGCMDGWMVGVRGGWEDGALDRLVNEMLVDTYWIYGGLLEEEKRDERDEF